MIITLENIGKRFQRHRIFKDVGHSFKAPNAYALLGSNGSGKSTLPIAWQGAFLQRPAGVGTK